ncbi:MAG: YtxH domain-containing protein [Phormidesmis sp. FL-bin-119]|nr:YtxH domain-containing protein [Pedobacter sp.]
MGLLRLLITGAAVAAGIHYATKKRADGSSFVDDLKAKAPDLMDKAKPYIDQVKNRVSEISGGSGNSRSYPQKFDTSVHDTDSTYSS